MPYVKGMPLFNVGPAGAGLASGRGRRPARRGPAAARLSAGSKTTAFISEFAPRPGDFVLQKSLGGAFSRTNFDAELRSRGIDTLIVAGWMTHLAVLMTVSDASVLGYRVLVAADATATRALPGSAGGADVDAKTLGE